jgi:PAS domain S-box-containing protein
VSDDSSRDPALYQRLVEGIRDYAIFHLDLAGRVLTWNKGGRLLFGYSAEEVQGQHFSRFFLPEDREKKIPEQELIAARERGSVEYEGSRVRKDGSRFWADSILTALLDDDGNVTGYVKVVRDLTERKKQEEELRRSEERFRLLVESVFDYAIFMLDPDGRVASWNAGAQRIKGYSAAEIVGQSFARFYPPEDVAAGKTKRLLETARREGVVEDEGWRVRKNGEKFWANVVITAVHDEEGRLRGFAKVTRDMSDRREAEEARVRLAKAEAAIRLRDEFLSVASHELRTPVTGLQLRIQSLARRAEKLVGEVPPSLKLTEELTRLQSQGRRLEALIDSLLDVSRIASGRMHFEFEHCDIADITREVVDLLQEPAKGAGSHIRLHIDRSTTGNWDRTRVAQVITNLVNNSIRYGAGKPIDVHVTANDGRAVVEVKDYGIGIKQEDRARIFERFEQAIAWRNYGGLGLGLYIAQQIVSAHNGTIAVESQPGVETTFRVELPTTPAS